MPPSTPAPPVIRWSPRRSRGSGGCIVIRMTSSRNTEAGGAAAMDKDEEFEERAAAAAEVAARLRSRGIAVTGAENSEALVDLLSAVERVGVAGRALRGGVAGGDMCEARARRPHLFRARLRLGARRP